MTEKVTDITKFIANFVTGREHKGRLGNYYILDFGTCTVLCFKYGIGKQAVIGLHVGEGVSFLYDHRPRQTRRSVSFPAYVPYVTMNMAEITGDITESGLIDMDTDRGDALIKLGSHKYHLCPADYIPNAPYQYDIGARFSSRSALAKGYIYIEKTRHDANSIEEAREYLIPTFDYPADTDPVYYYGYWFLPIQKGFKVPKIPAQLEELYRNPPCLIDYPELMTVDIVDINLKPDFDSATGDNTNRATKDAMYKYMRDKEEWQSAVRRITKFIRGSKLLSIFTVASSKDTKGEAAEDMNDSYIRGTLTPDVSLFPGEFSFYGMKAMEVPPFTLETWHKIIPGQRRYFRKTLGRTITEGNESA